MCVRPMTTGLGGGTDVDSFRYERAAFYSGIKGKVGLIFEKAAALRININTDGSPVDRAAHTSQTTRTLLASSAVLPILLGAGRMTWMNAAALL